MDNEEKNYRFWAGSSIYKPKEIAPCEHELFYEIANHPDLRRLAAEIIKTESKEERDKMKRQAPYYLFHAGDVANGYRANKNITDSGLRMLDMDDDRMNFKEFYQQRVQPRIEELGIVLVHRSLGNPRHRGHIIFEAPRDPIFGDWLTIEQSQEWMAEKLQVQYDHSCSELQRPSFAVPSEWILYINEEKLFNNL